VEILLYLLGGLLLLAGLAGLVLPVVPGALLMFAGTLLVAWGGHFERIGWRTLTVVGILSLTMMVVDWVATALGARASGASRWAVLGATLGLVIGLFLGPAGILLGPVVGAAVLEWWRDADLERAMKAGLGTLLGFVAGGVVKVVLAFLLLGALGVALLAN
jgi:uncharacterized protein